MAITRDDYADAFHLLGAYYTEASKFGDNDFYYQILPVMSQDLRKIVHELPDQPDAIAKKFEQKENGEEYNVYLIDLLTVYDVLGVYF